MRRADSAGPGAAFRARLNGFCADGSCFGYAESGRRRVYIPYAAAGDAVVAVPDGSFARLKELLQSGKGRTAPRCPVYFRLGASSWCGGCNFQHLNYQEQLRAKTEIVGACLKARRLNVPFLPAALASPEIWGYRNKVQLPFSLSGGTLKSGFYHPGTHNIVDSCACPVSSPLAVAIAAWVKKTAQSRHWSVYDEETHRGWLRHLLVRVNWRGEALVAFVGNGRPQFQLEPVAEGLRREFGGVCSVYLNIQEKVTSVILGNTWEKIYGETQLEEKIGKHQFLLYPGSFLQVNTKSAERLYAVVSDFLSRGEKTPTLYDVYCGVGAITLSASRGFKNTVGIEENRGAVACAWKNAERNKIHNVSFVCGRAELALPARLRRENCSVVLDPPRQGCHEKLLMALLRGTVRKIVYVSCNPVTFARDASFLRGAFSLKCVQPVDLFPQTSHIETVGYFERNKA